MNADRHKLAGALFFLGVAQLVLAIILAEAYYQGPYSVSANAISDLGVGPTAPWLNYSMILFGLTLFAGAYLIREIDTAFILLLSITSIGAVGVGLFPETNAGLHSAFSVLIFMAGPLAAISAYRITPSPLRQLSVLAGAFSLVFLLFYVLGKATSIKIGFGLGLGGMERMNVYPLFLWDLCFAGFLMAPRKNERTRGISS